MTRFIYLVDETRIFAGEIPIFGGKSPIVSGSSLLTAILGCTDPRVLAALGHRMWDDHLLLWENKQYNG